MNGFEEKTSSQDIFWDAKNEIVIGVLTKNVTSLEDAIENIDAQERIRDKLGVAKTRVLIDMSVISEISKEARDYFANERTAKIQRACALYITSGIGRVVGNFFMGLNKPHTPTQLFTDKEKAIKWLKTFSSE